MAIDDALVTSHLHSAVSICPVSTITEFYAFQAAAGGDKKGCTKEQFERFLHPEEFDDMREIVLKETMGDMDKNADGVIDMNEYISKFSKFY